MGSDAAYLEVHHFTGGLEVAFFGPSVRPDWLPGSALVQLSQAIAIRPDELIIELSRHREAGRLVTWIGAYRASGTAYGNRGAYCAVGAWLVDCYPVDCLSIVNGLSILTKKLSEVGFNDVIGDNCSKFQKVFLPAHSRHVDFLRSESTGVPYDESRFPSTIFVKMSKDAPTESLLKAVADSIVEHTFSEKPQFQASRLIYILSASTKITDPEANYRVLDVTRDSSVLVIDRLIGSAIESRESFRKELDQLAAQKQRILLLVQENDDLQRHQANASMELERLKSANEALELERKRNLPLSRHTLPATSGNPREDGAQGGANDRTTRMISEMSGTVLRIDRTLSLLVSDSVNNKRVDPSDPRRGSPPAKAAPSTSVFDSWKVQLIAYSFVALAVVLIVLWIATHPRSLTNLFAQDKTQSTYEPAVATDASLSSKDESTSAALSTMDDKEREATSADSAVADVDRARKTETAGRAKYETQGDPAADSTSGQESTDSKLKD